MVTKVVNKLKDLVITEVSLVGAPANPYARVTLFKHNKQDTYERKRTIASNMRIADARMEAVAAIGRQAGGDDLTEEQAVSLALEKHPELYEYL